MFNIFGNGISRELPERLNQVFPVELSCYCLIFLLSECLKFIEIFELWFFHLLLFNFHFCLNSFLWFLWFRRCRFVWFSKWLFLSEGFSAKLCMVRIGFRAKLTFWYAIRWDLARPIILNTSSIYSVVIAVWKCRFRSRLSILESRVTIILDLDAVCSYCQN